MQICHITIYSNSFVGYIIYIDIALNQGYIKYCLTNCKQIGLVIFYVQVISVNINFSNFV